MSLSVKLDAVMEKIIHARKCWWLGRTYEEALRTYAEIEDDLSELSPEDDSEIERLNQIARMFHEEAGRLLKVIGEEDRAMEHMKKALELHPPEHLRGTRILSEDLPIPDPKAVWRELKKEREDYVKGVPYPASPAVYASQFVKLAETMMGVGMTEDAHEMLADFLDSVKKAEDERDGDWGPMNRDDYFVVSHAHELLGNVDEAMSYLQKAAQADMKIQDVVEERVEERVENNYRKALMYEQTGAIFEKLDPGKALECYDLAEKHFAKAPTSDERPRRDMSLGYDLEFLRQLGHLWPLFRFDTFARLALRRQRLLAVIDGEAGYPLRREPRSTR